MSNGMHLYHVKIAGTKVVFPAYLIVSIQVISTSFFRILRNAVSAACSFKSLPNSIRLTK